MNGRLGKSLVNPWLASAVSFALITFFFAGAFFIMPHPLPTVKDLSTLPWWAVIGGLVGAVQVYAGLTFVTKVGAGPFMGITVTAALLASVASSMRIRVRGPSLRSIEGGLLQCSRCRTAAVWRAKITILTVRRLRSPYEGPGWGGQMGLVFLFSSGRRTGASVCIDGTHDSD